MSKPDLVVLKQGRPVAVVEAKARPVPPSFQQASLNPLRNFSADTGSRLSNLVGSEDVTNFRGTNVDRALITLSTGELLRPTTLSRSGVVGERVLLEAVDRWLHAL